MVARSTQFGRKKVEGIIKSYGGDKSLLISILLYDLAETCIGCGGCAYVCPTEAVKIENNKIRLGDKIFKELSPKEVKKVKEKFEKGEKPAERE